MEEKLQRLYNECLQELKTIGINFTNNKNIGEIDISIANRSNKIYACCKQQEPDERYKTIEKRKNKTIIKYEKYNINHIEISNWVMDLEDSIIKNTIIHELIHCIPFCNNHKAQFKKYATYINNNLGYNINTVGNPKEDYKKSNIEYKEEIPKYKYKIKCEQCGQQIYRKRLNMKLIKHYRCGKCGGKLKAINIE